MAYFVDITARANTKDAESKMLALTNRMQDAFKKVATWSISAVAFQQMSKFFTSGIGYVKELDKSLTEIAIVTGMSRNQMAGVTVEFNKMAKSLGVTTKEVANASLIYYQQGKSAQEVMQLTKATAMTAAITETKDLAEASSYITAALNGFKMSAAESMTVVDKFAQVGAQAGTSFREMALALSRTASSANNAGISLDAMLGMMGTVSEVTREAPENIGTSFKTIIARLRNITTEEGADLLSTKELNKVDVALSSIGVSVRDFEGKMRDLEPVIYEVGNKWGSLDKNTQAYIATVMAGTRQQSRLISMFDNWDRVLELTTMSQNSAGTGMDQFSRHAEGLDFAINSIKAGFEELFSDTFKTEDLKDIANDFKFFLEGIIDINKEIPALTLAFKALGLAGIVALLPRIANGFKFIGTSIANLFSSIRNVNQMPGGLMGSLMSSKTGDLFGQTGATSKYNATALNQYQTIEKQMRQLFAVPTNQNISPEQRNAYLRFMGAQIDLNNKQTENIKNGMAKNYNLHEDIKNIQKQYGILANQVMLAPENSPAAKQIKAMAAYDKALNDAAKKRMKSTGESRGIVEQQLKAEAKHWAAIEEQRQKMQAKANNVANKIQQAQTRIATPGMSASTIQRDTNAIARYQNQLQKINADMNNLGKTPKALGALTNARVDLNAVNASAQRAGIGMRNLAQGVKGVVTALGQIGVVGQFLTSLGWMAAFAGIFLVIGKLKDASKASSDMIAQQNELKKNRRDLWEDLNKIEKYNKTYQELKDKSVKTKEESTLYDTSLKELSSLYPEIIAARDAEGNVISINADKLERLIALKEKEKALTESQMAYNALQKPTQQQGVFGTWWSSMFDDLYGGSWTDILPGGTIDDIFNSKAWSQNPTKSYNRLLMTYGEDFLRTLDSNTRELIADANKYAKSSKELEDTFSKKIEEIRTNKESSLPGTDQWRDYVAEEQKYQTALNALETGAELQKQNQASIAAVTVKTLSDFKTADEEILNKYTSIITESQNRIGENFQTNTVQLFKDQKFGPLMKSMEDIAQREQDINKNTSLSFQQRQDELQKLYKESQQVKEALISPEIFDSIRKAYPEITDSEVINIVEGLKKENSALETEVENSMRSQVLLRNISQQSLMDLKKQYQSIDFDTIESSDAVVKKLMDSLTDENSKQALQTYFKDMFSIPVEESFGNLLSGLKIDTEDATKIEEQLKSINQAAISGGLGELDFSKMNIYGKTKLVKAATVSAKDFIEAYNNEMELQGGKKIDVDLINSDKAIQDLMEKFPEIVEMTLKLKVDTEAAAAAFKEFGERNKALQEIKKMAEEGAVTADLGSQKQMDFQQAINEYSSEYNPAFAEQIQYEYDALIAEGISEAEAASKAYTNVLNTIQQEAENAENVANKELLEANKRSERFYNTIKNHESLLERVEGYSALTEDQKQYIKDTYKNLDTVEELEGVIGKLKYLQDKEVSDKGATEWLGITGNSEENKKAIKDFKEFYSALSSSTSGLKDYEAASLAASLVNDQFTATSISAFLALSESDEAMQNIGSSIGLSTDELKKFQERLQEINEIEDPFERLNTGKNYINLTKLSKIEGNLNQKEFEEMYGTKYTEFANAFAPDLIKQLNQGLEDGIDLADEKLYKEIIDKLDKGNQDLIDYFQGKTIENKEAIEKYLDSMNINGESKRQSITEGIELGSITKENIQDVIGALDQMSNLTSENIDAESIINIGIKYNLIDKGTQSPDDLIKQLEDKLGIAEGETIDINVATNLITGVQGGGLANLLGIEQETLEPQPINLVVSTDNSQALLGIGQVYTNLGKLKNKDIIITTHYVSEGTPPSTTSENPDYVGTAYATGTPFALGGLSLVGEQGRELAIYPDGTIQMLGTKGAHLANIPQGTTILPNKVTEDLFKRSRRNLIYSGKIPGFENGSEGLIGWIKSNDSSSDSSSSSSGNDNGSKKAKEDAEKFFDLLEEALERIDQKIEVIQDRIDDTFDMDDKISLSKEYLSLLEHQESVMEKGFALRKTAYQDEIKNVRQLGILTSDQLDAIIEGNFNLSELGISISNDNKDAQKALDDLIKARDDYYNLEQKIQKIDNDILSVMQDMVDAVDDMDLSLEQKAVEYIKVNNQLRSQELRFIDQKYKVQEQIRNQEAEALKAKYTEIAAQEVFNSIQTEAIQNLDVETLKILNLGNFIDQGLRQTMLDFIATFVQADAELNEVQDTVKGIENSIKEANAAWLNTYVEQYNDAIDESKTNISLLDNFQASLVENSDEYIANINDQNTSLVEQVKLLTQQKAFYEYALNNLELTAEEQRNIKESIRGINEEIASARAEIFNQLQSLANDVIEMYKQVLEEQKEQDLDRIDDLIDAEDERHDKIMDDLQDELDMWNSIIEAKLKALKREKEADDYNEQLSKLEEERQELQDLINALAIDTSYEAQAKLKKLGEELSDKELEISELKEDRQYELREQNLNDMLDLYEKDVEAKEDAEDEKYEATKKALEQEKEDRERFWDDQINNEARWMRIRRDILNGNLTEVKADFAEFGSFIKANLDDIGNNIGMNMIDQMSDFITEIQNAQSALTQLNSISANYNSNNLQGTKGTPVSTPSSSGQMTPEAKALIKKMITEYDNNGGDMYILQRRIQELADNFGIYVKLVNGHYQITNGSYAGTNLRALHSGGIVGNISNEATEIANKLLNTSPNERVIKALVGELYSPADNIRKNFIPNLTTALESVQPIGLIGSGGNNYELNMNIESLNGTKKDAQTVFKEIVKGFRAMGGGV